MIQKLKELKNNIFYGVFLAADPPAYSKGIKSTVFDSIKGMFGEGLPTTETFGGLVTIVVQILLVVAGSVAVIFLIVGGYRYITASGNEEQTEGAKKTMTGAIVGIVIIALAYAVIAIIVNILQDNTGLTQ